VNECQSIKALLCLLSDTSLEGANSITGFAYFEYAMNSYFIQNCLFDKIAFELKIINLLPPISVFSRGL